MSTNLKLVLGVIIGAVVGIGGYYVATHYSLIAVGANASATSTQATSTRSSTPTQAAADEKPLADVGYLCDAKKTIHAVYFTKKVIIELSDGRAMELPQTISASGIRYANKDESLVFWSKGPTAFFQELGKTTYDKCVQLDTSSVEGQ